jgi:5-methyltetrahydrofolate--homocysteine methyltransferase
MPVSTEFSALIEAIQQGEKDEGVQQARQLVDGGISVFNLFENAVVPCLEDIGERFSKLELYLPDMMRSAEVVKAIQEELDDPNAVEGNSREKGTVIIGTVYGDIHDIGKNIVASMLGIHGFKVVDLGCNVAAKDFIARARDENADIIALSSLLTTSIPFMKDVVTLVQAKESDVQRFKIIVGGGPVSSEIAEQIGANSYGEDAAEAVTKIKALLEE